MSKNQKKLYIRIFIAIVFSVVILFFIDTKEKEDVIQNIVQESVVPSPQINNKPKTQIVDTPPKNTQSATVLAGATTAHLSFAPDTSFYDTLVQAKSAGQIEFAGKNYPGLGFFVTDIGTLHASRGKYLLYYINGTEATVGVSSYTLKDGDIIEWKLE
ncbi:hypothetical protein A2643_03605 [Candidatus Nomurabacteria bacterium RIFCSPHIGHO2_01_FULL_39_220]|uniref:Transcobalamin-like C-terminal domain-containing protein n=1 Tax=Candidatus Nomurabacteria bacterium RIFCSPLOWO2_02_FULL_40_67 TaxID=1801787 RepID=A0A1F6Y3E8_9BACT|nr:MAG: hypothetical protein UU01_C0017G0002 [Parcubacteria group bacterium GW2011_GWA2_40_37]KKS11354.1 MAG: hypothetical protein UU66_C0020G0015 [Parcubacteria group bacterium GW2011_GWB1_41_5]KKS70631.1 MAG: hypothetical protein UV43_C0057G0002 [Parcubacteria group bacterium GW2011_GWF2_42_7]OGI62492.1 MAG: hypothetical protein A2W12_01085 [Candidatus Nomurabacteria bacterium RBG_16_40_11]OGI69456.1 MAG: hypothetical protein A2643_03605 [Candidatus Nomurabacteria bacterium RIFCSPHIGHO2_01_FU